MSIQASPHSLYPMNIVFVCFSKPILNVHEHVHEFMFMTVSEFQCAGPQWRH